MALSAVSPESLHFFASEESGLEDLAGFLQECVAVAAAFDDAGFEAMGAVGDMAVRKVLQKPEALGGALCVVRVGIGRAGRGGEYIVARAGEAEWAGF